MRYLRDAQGRITAVETRKTSTGAWTVVANAIAYQPFSRLVQAMSFGNGLNAWNTYTLDYELDVLGLYDGARTSSTGPTRAPTTST